MFEAACVRIIRKDPVDGCHTFEVFSGIFTESQLDILIEVLDPHSLHDRCRGMRFEGQLLNMSYEIIG